MSNIHNTILLEGIRENSKIKAEDIKDIDIAVPDEDEDLEEIERIRTGKEE